MVKFGSQRIGSPRRTCQQRSESVFSAEPNEGFTLRPICAHDTAASSRYWRLCILRVSRKLLSSWIDVLVTNTATTKTCRNIYNAHRHLTRRFLPVQVTCDAAHSVGRMGWAFSTDTNTRGAREIPRYVAESPLANLPALPTLRPAMPPPPSAKPLSGEHRPAERHRTPCERPCPSWQGWPPQPDQEFCV
jgi:hypothetical protein